MSVTVLQLHKRASYTFDLIQDKYAINKAKKAYALADGTTQSFMSEKWSEILVNSFVQAPTFESHKLIEQFSGSAEQLSNSAFNFSTNPAKASLERAKKNKGATATFTGIQISETGILEAISCGDTNLFLISQGQISESFPFSDFETLDANQHFINTQQLLDGKVDSSYFKTANFKVISNDIIILATDALSRWIFQNSEFLEQLVGINDFEKFLSFCKTEWENKKLQEDDITALIIRVDNIGKINEILPFKKFSFPKEEELEFRPTEIKSKSENNFNTLEMDEIRQQFNGVAKDFYKVNKKLKLNIVFLVVTIGMLIAVLISVLYVQFEIKKSNQQTTVIQNRQKEIEILQQNEIKNNSKIKQLESDLKNLKKSITNTPPTDTITTKNKSAITSKK